MTHSFTFNLPTIEEWVPYGNKNRVSIYVKDDALGEKDFTGYMPSYDFHFYQNIIDTGVVLFYSIEGDEQNYLVKGNRVKVFVNNRIRGVFQIKKVAFDTTSAATVILEGIESKAKRKITDRSTYNKSDTASDTVTKTLLSVNGDTVAPWHLVPGQIQNFGNVFFRAEYEEKLPALLQQAAQHQADMWISWNESESYDIDYYNLKQNRGSGESVFTFATKGAERNCHLCSKAQDQDNIINNVICLGSGNGSTQLVAEQYASTINKTQLNGGDTWLNGNHTAAITTVTVNSTTGFPSSGDIKIGKEKIAYTDTTGTTFTGCTRASGGTTAAIHFDGTDVMGLTTLIVDSTANLPSSGTVRIGQEEITYSAKPTSTTLTITARGSNAYAHSDNIDVRDAQYTTTAPETDSPVEDSGLVSAKFDYREIINQNQLDLFAQQILLEYQTGKPNIIVLPIDLFDVLAEQRIELGDTVTIKDSRSDLNNEDYIIKKLHLFKPRGAPQALEIELGKVRANFIQTLASTKQLSGSLSSYAQGTLIPVKADMARNCQSGKNLDLNIFLPKDTLGIKYIKLMYSTSPYRAFTTTSSVTNGSSVVASSAQFTGGDGNLTYNTWKDQGGYVVSNPSESVMICGSLILSTAAAANNPGLWVRIYDGTTYYPSSSGIYIGEEDISTDLHSHSHSHAPSDDEYFVTVLNDGSIGAVLTTNTVDNHQHEPVDTATDFVVLDDDSSIDEVHLTDIDGTTTRAVINPLATFSILVPGDMNGKTLTVQVKNDRNITLSGVANNSAVVYSPHTHDMAYAIDESTGNNHGNITVDVDSTAEGTTFTADQEQEIDVFDVSGVEWKPGQWHTVTVKPSGTCFLDASVFGLIYIEGK